MEIVCPLNGLGKINSTHQMCQYRSDRDPKLWIILFVVEIESMKPWLS